MSKAEVFPALHHGRPAGDPLVLAGPWDAASARALAAAGFPAPATPGAGVAASLGYADGGTPAAEMFARVDGDGPSPAELGELGATRVMFGPGLLRPALRSLDALPR